MMLIFTGFVILSLLIFSSVFHQSSLGTIFDRLLSDDGSECSRRRVVQSSVGKEYSLLARHFSGSNSCLADGKRISVIRAPNVRILSRYLMFI
jgi:hypothetical protein